MRNNEKVNIVQSVIIYNHKNLRTGQNERFISRVIPKDEITLFFYLDKQQNGKLYVDPNDRSRYYFDLNFLTAQG